MSADQIAIPDSTFVTYISPKGSISNVVAKQAYEKTGGKRVQYVELSSGNHYAINDWNPVSAPYQVSRCVLLTVLPGLSVITVCGFVQHYAAASLAKQVTDKSCRFC